MATDLTTVQNNKLRDSKSS